MLEFGQECLHLGEESVLREHICKLEEGLVNNILEHGEWRLE